jgi:shikimate dehydrogenase
VATAEFRNGRLMGPDGQSRAWPDLAVFGDPVQHSLSPRLHAAALSGRGIEAEYVAIRVTRDDLADALVAALDGGVRGLNLTVPLKEDGLRLATRAADECRRIGAANTLVARSGEWTAHNTDARGLAMALERDLGAALSRQLGDCLILGSGGSARAAVVALEGLGARRITVAARTIARADWCLEFGARALPLEDIHPSDASIVVNCTPVGLDPDASPVIDPSRLGADAYILDLTYAERPSRLLAEFTGRGQDGRAMLVAQAALAFSVWYGALPPLPDMAAAIGLDW